MNRRRLTILLPLAAATLTAGCTTFSDNDAIARVGDTELAIGDLDRLATDAGLPSEQEVTGDVARQLITQWIQDAVVEGELFEAQPVEVTDDDVSTLYPQGADVSGVVCPAVMLTDTIADAESAEARIRAGEPFADVFADANVLETLDPVTGAVGCFPLSDLDAAEGQPDAEAIRTVSSERPVATAELLGETGAAEGAILVAFRPYDQLDEAERAGVEQAIAGRLQEREQQRAIENIDVHVDPRYGTFDSGTVTVLPLG